MNPLNTQDAIKWCFAILLLVHRKKCPICNISMDASHFFELHPKAKCKSCSRELRRSRSGKTKFRQWCRVDSPNYKESSRIRLLEYKLENPITGCWEFSGRLNSDGYGTFKYTESNALAHRASWLIHNGEIPNGQYVLHKCDNPRCFNPEHLFLGTQKENVADCISKGRFHH